MPRGITPSDLDITANDKGDIGPVDFAINNDLAQRTLLCELSSRTALWSQLPHGQHRLYRSLVKSGRGDIVAVLCHHAEPPPGELIDTVRHILEFQIMVWDKDGIGYSKVHPGRKWIRAVRALLSS